MSQRLNDRCQPLCVYVYVCADTISISTQNTMHTQTDTPVHSATPHQTPNDAQTNKRRPTRAVPPEARHGIVVVHTACHVLRSLNA